MVVPAGSLIPHGDRAFGKFDLLAKLATGGMAEIYLARVREGSDEVFVIKRVLPHLAEDPRFVAMFRDEARLSSRIEHENVCRVFELGHVGHEYFLSMEYLHGVTLADACRRSQTTDEPLDVRLVAGIITQCCAGLHHAHELESSDGKSLEVVHRDVSPANIFMTESGVVKVLDFGVAKARGATQRTSTGMVKGKNSYMSPEQILGRDLDRRSDVFSLGICLWEGLTAERLFARDTDFLTFTAITEAEIPSIRELRPDIPGALADVIHRALSRDRDERQATVVELAEDVESAMAMMGGFASPEEISDFVNNRFSIVLTNRQDLLEAIDADDPDLEADTEPTVDPAPHDDRAATDADPDPEADAFHVDTGFITEEVAQLQAVKGRPPPWLWIVVAGVLVVAAFAVGLSLRSEQRAAVPDTADAAAVAPDAEVDEPIGDSSDATAVVAAPIDAGAPDARVRKVDNRPGYFSIDSRPYATIYANGKKLGVTPVFKKKLAPGRYRIKAVSATGAVKRFRIKIRPGRTTSKGRLRWD